MKERQPENNTPPETSGENRQLRRGLQWITAGGIMTAGSLGIPSGEGVTIGATVMVLGGLEIFNWLYSTRSEPMNGQSRMNLLITASDICNRFYINSVTYIKSQINLIPIIEYSN
jgi:hypothetical protein